MPWLTTVATLAGSRVALQVVSSSKLSTNVLSASSATFERYASSTQQIHWPGSRPASQPSTVIDTVAVLLVAVPSTK